MGPDLSSAFQKTGAAMQEELGTKAPAVTPKITVNAAPQDIEKITAQVTREAKTQAIKINNGLAKGILPILKNLDDQYNTAKAHFDAQITLLQSADVPNQAAITAYKNLQKKFKGFIELRKLLASLEQKHATLEYLMAGDEALQRAAYEFEQINTNLDQRLKQLRQNNINMQYDFQSDINELYTQLGYDTYSALSSFRSDYVNMTYNEINQARQLEYSTIERSFLQLRSLIKSTGIKLPLGKIEELVLQLHTAQTKVYETDMRIQQNDQNIGDLGGALSRKMITRAAYQKEFDLLDQQLERAQQAKSSAQKDVDRIQKSLLKEQNALLAQGKKYFGIGTRFDFAYTEQMKPRQSSRSGIQWEDSGKGLPPALIAILVVVGVIVLISFAQSQSKEKIRSKKKTRIKHPALPPALLENLPATQT
jgi:hypothetical protein